MSQPSLVLLVRLQSDLSLEEVTRVMDERAPEFAALDGLIQKYYLQDPVSGDYAGLYLWASAEHLDAFRESELKETIARAYQTRGEPRIEVYQVMKALRD